MSNLTDEARAKDTLTICNRENGSFSQLFGRDCWVADAMVSLIQSAFEPGEMFDTTDETHALLVKIENYCKELRQKNREPYFDDTIWTEDRPV